MERIDRERRKRRSVLLKSFGLIVGLCVAAWGPAHGITVAKLNITNAYSASTHQRVRVYGLPPLILSSPPSTYTTKPYTSLTYAPYPYSTSTSTQALLRLNTGLSIARGEYASAVVSTLEPQTALSVSDWAWWTRTSTGSEVRIGAVPDPSMSREQGPSSLGLGPTSDWISLNITFRNTLKPVIAEAGAPPAALARPTSRIAYMDFGVGAHRALDPEDPGDRLRQVAVEQYYGARSILKVNPNSQGQLAQAFDLLRNSSSGYVANGQSVADDGLSATLFVPPIVLEGRPAPIPSRARPVTAHVLSFSPGVGETMRIQSAERILTHVSLAPGSSITFQVRVLLGAFEGFGVGTNSITPFRPLFLSRMREVTVQDGVEITDAVFAGAADYPRDIPGQLSAQRPTVAEPRTLDRQDWAHRLSLYNRALKYYGGPAALRGGGF